MSANKYKVGDKVIVRRDLKDGERYGGILAITSMVNFRGKPVTIRDDNGGSYYYIKEFHCVWSDEMFEGLAYKPVALSPEEKEKLIRKSEVFLDLLK